MLLKEIAELSGTNFDVLSQDVVSLQRIQAQAEVFETSIAPQRLTALLNDREIFRARVKTFMAITGCRFYLPA